jgi:hypothetical protein
VTEAVTVPATGAACWWLTGSWVASIVAVGVAVLPLVLALALNGRRLVRPPVSSPSDRLHWPVVVFGGVVPVVGTEVVLFVRGFWREAIVLAVLGAAGQAAVVARVRRRRMTPPSS